MSFLCEKSVRKETTMTREQKCSNMNIIQKKKVRGNHVI